MKSGEFKYKKIDGRIYFEKSWLQNHLKHTLRRMFNELVIFWHLIIKLSITPDDVSYGSGKYVCWKF